MNALLWRMSLGCLWLMPALAAAQAAAADAGVMAEHGALRPKPTSELALEDVDEQTLRKALARYAHEPDVATVVRRALAVAQQQRVDFAGLARRARLQGWLPRVSLSIRHGQALDWVGDQTDPGAQLRITSDRDVTLYAALTFDLPKLLFSEAEVPLARQQQAEQAERRRLIPQLVALYFERRRLLLLRDLALRGDVATHMRIFELEALLDAFTGGAFSSMIEPRSPAQLPALNNGEP